MKLAKLDETPELRDKLATMLAVGSTRRAIAAEFEVSEWTVTQWRKRPDVQDKVSKIIKERANRILALTDSRLESLLHEKGSKMTVDQLIKVRTAFAGENLNLNLQGEGSAALRELLQAMHEDPELAGALAKLGFDAEAA